MTDADALAVGSVPGAGPPDRPARRRVAVPATEVDGHLVEIRGVRAWPGGWADAIRVRFTTDAAALRCDYDGGITWQRDGGLTDVVDELVALPAPGQRLAPVLVLGRAPALWVP